jgi:hypothetical protein
MLLKAMKMCVPSFGVHVVNNMFVPKRQTNIIAVDYNRAAKLLSKWDTILYSKE